MRAMRSSVQSVSRLVARWWREPVDYEAQVQNYARRSLADAIRAMIGLAVGLAAGIAAALVSLGGADTMRAAGVVVAFAALMTYWSLMWWSRPWPTRRTSLVFVASVDIGAAALMALGPGWATQLFGLTCFAWLSTYLMFFDGPKALAVHMVWTAISTVALVGEQLYVNSGGSTAVAVAILAATLPLLTVPLGIQLGIWALRGDAHASVTDPLTGVLNRRGLLLHFANLLGDKPFAGPYVTVMLIDLDRFKELNDAYGHSTGDKVLIHCARTITAVVPDGALVARVGGEEFVVVDLTEQLHDDTTSERIREAIALRDDHPAISASVGVTGVPRAHFSSSLADCELLLTDLIARADQAMFCAKRSGGNAIERR
ncbi:hypothetical protein EB75_13250 [Mycobacterium sp. ST-F2]|nr:hypothetical protein EB75_13250 [Mycobacterium sp. ST-F2]